MDHTTVTPQPNFRGSAAQCYTATTVRPNPARPNFANNELMSPRNLFTDFGQVPITPPPHGSAFFPASRASAVSDGPQGLQTMHSAPHQPYLRLQNFLTATIRPSYRYDPANDQDDKGHKRMSKIPRSLWTQWAAMCAGLEFNPKRPNDQNPQMVMENIINGRFFDDLSIPQVLEHATAQEGRIRQLEQALEREKARVQALSAELSDLRAKYETLNQQRLFPDLHQKHQSMNQQSPCPNGTPSAGRSKQVPSELIRLPANMIKHYGGVFQSAISKIDQAVEEFEEEMQDVLQHSHSVNQDGATVAEPMPEIKGYQLGIFQNYADRLMENMGVLMAGLYCGRRFDDPCVANSVKCRHTPMTCCTFHIQKSSFIQLASQACMLTETSVHVQCFSAASGGQSRTTWNYKRFTARGITARHWLTKADQSRMGHEGIKLLAIHHAGFTFSRM